MLNIQEARLDFSIVKIHHHRLQANAAETGRTWLHKKHFASRVLCRDFAARILNDGTIVEKDWIEITGENND